MGDRSAYARFGGNRGWTLADGTWLDVGEVITSAGPGEGFAMLPWALDHYERALRLRPEETWLLKRLLMHAWEDGGEVYLSLHKITREAMVTRNRLKRMLARLEALGYVTRLGPAAGDKRRHYSVRGLYDALAVCIAADPDSKWAKEHGALPYDQVRPKTSSDGVRLDLNLETLARHNGHAALVELVET